MPQMNTASLFTQSSADNSPSERRRQLARLLLARGLDDSPIQHPTQGAARMAHALIAGLEMRRADEEDKKFGDLLKADPRFAAIAPQAPAQPKSETGFSLASLLSGLSSAGSPMSAPTMDPDNIGAGATPFTFMPPEVVPPPVMAAPQLPPQALSLAPANQPIAPQIIPPQVAPPQTFNPLDPNMMELERPNAPVRAIGTPPPVSPQEYINRGWDDMYGRTPAPQSRPKPRDDADAVTNAETPQDYINRAWGGLTPQGRDIAARTVLGEAANQGQTGMNAVADVMRNRAQSGRYGGDTMDQVALARKQFEPWMTQAGRDRMAAYSPAGEPYRAAQASVDTAAIGSRPDVTGNAQYFYAPKAQAALAPVDGRPVVPSFARGQEPSAVIGDHNFYQERSRLAQANPQAALPPQAQLAQQQPAPPQVAQPQQPPAAAAASRFGQATNEQMREYAQRLYASGNPRAISAAMDIMKQINAPQEYDYKDNGNGTWTAINKKDPTDVRIARPPQTTAPNGPGAIPPPPPGADPKKWAEEWTAATAKSKVSDALPADWATTSQLRKELQDLPSYKNLAQSAPVYHSMLDAAKRDNRAADVNMIYGMAKLMDPGSVVRESEMTVAQAVATLPQALQANVMSQINSTGRLSPEVREAIMQEAYSRIRSYEYMFNQTAGEWRGMAERRRMNPDDVLPKFGPFEEFKRPEVAAQQPQGTAQPKTKQDYDQLKSGTPYLDPTGRMRIKP